MPQSAAAVDQAPQTVPPPSPDDAQQSIGQVRRILEHPDFYQLEPKNQKALLSQIIPSFNDLSDLNFDNMIEKIAPEAYAVNKRSGPAQVKVEPTKFPTAVRVAETVSSAAEGLGKTAALVAGTQSAVPLSPEEYGKEFKEAKDIVGGMVRPFVHLPTDGMNEFFERHPEAGGSAQDQIKLMGTMTGFISGIFGGDPDQAWRDWSAGMIGPGFASLLTGPAITYGTGKAIKAAIPEETPAMSPKQTAVANERLASLLSIEKPLESPVTGEIRDRLWVVRTVRPMINQALDRLGISDTAPARQRVGAFFGDKATGAIQGNWTGAFAGRRSLLGMHRLEAEQIVDATGQPRTDWVSGVRAGARRTLQVADEVVNISQEPFDKVIGRYGSEGVNDIKPEIVNDLTGMAQGARKMGNNSQAQALEAMTGVVKEARNIQELNQIKVNSNKMIQDALGGTPGQQIGQTADNIYAWRLLGDAIRDHMYNKLQKLSGVDLRPFGEREHAAIMFRDGLYFTYFRDIDPSQAKAVAMGYLGSIEHGSLWERHIIQRAGRMSPEPAGQYNIWFRKGIGKVGKGGVAEGIEPVPFRQMRPGLPPAEGGGPPFFEIPTGIPEEIIHGEAVTRAEKRYAGKQIVDVPEEPRSRYPEAQEDEEAAERDRRQADQYRDANKEKIAQLQTKLDNLKVQQEDLRKKGETGQKMVKLRDEIESTFDEMSKLQFSRSTAPASLKTGQDPIIQESIRLAREELKDAPKDKSGMIPQGLMERAREIEKRLRAEKAKSAPPVEETHSPMEGGSRTQARTEIGTTEGTIPESVFKRSKAKRRQDVVGSTGPIAPDKVYTGRPTRSESRWQFLPSSQEPTEGVTVEGGGTWRTNDPIRAYNTWNDLRRWVKGRKRPGSPAFKDLPPVKRREIMQGIETLGKQLDAYRQYRWGRDQVKVTPYKPGMVEDPYKWSRRAGTYAAGQAGPTREAQQDELMHELLEETRSAEQMVNQ